MTTNLVCSVAVMAVLSSLAPAVQATGEPVELNAKALFFGTDNQVRSVPTAPPAVGDKVAAAPASTAASAATTPPAKVASVAPKHAERRATRPAPATPMGASYFVRLTRKDGSTRDVLTSHDFRTGERFQIGLKVNKPTYVYIFNQESDGKFVQLYPQPGMANRVDAMGVMFFPGQGSFQFSGQSGTEEVSVLMSAKPLARPEASATTAQMDLVSAPANGAGRDICASTSNATTNAVAREPANPSRDDTRMVAMADTQGLTHKAIVFQAPAEQCGAQPRLASKAISFVDDANPGASGQPASYVVKAVSKPDDVLHLRLKLSHR